MPPEQEPQPSFEAIALAKLGYEHCLDTPIKAGSPIVGRNFLDAYGDSPKRQETEDLLRGFAEMPETDPDYQAAKTYIGRYLETYFGPPQVT